ncbi:tenascin-N-like [Dermacentor andersoni]|uniref:tenascin-N-like n=1 Tax=Dermacentor andersoni TaxID=34620 RepID=UPI0024160B54|nr:tenascin-N-like [Dermacentor andersoni]
MRTHLTGPPERSSPGVTITGIFIPAEEPNPPRNITMFPESPSRTRIQWDNPEKVYGIMASYNVKICGSFKSCDRAEGLSNCMEYVTLETWRVFGSREDTAYCILVTVNTQCGIHKVSSRPVIAEIRTPFFDLPDVTKLRLLSAVNNSITIAWERPKARFDYYWVSITPDKGEKHINAGSCGNGTIIHPDQTQVKCTSLEACTNVTVSVRTHRNGPPERTSVGVALQDIFVPGEEPDSPKNITTLEKSPSLTRLQWDPPARVSGRFIAYTVKICDAFKSCGTQESMNGCRELQTQDTGLDFHSTVDTKYCVLVAGSAQCGELVLNSLPAIAEIWTPLLHLPDVRKLSLLSAANNSITISWERPKTRFDYYWVDVTSTESTKSGSVQRNRVGSCASGSIIHSARTQVMCTNLEACTKVSFNIRTHRSGPPEHTSHGVDLKGIFIPGEDPDPPKNITMLGISPSLTRLQWVPGPKISGTFLGYVVKICSLFQSCVRETNMSKCIELQRQETWLNFISRVDTKYCVLVTARSKCGVQVLNGPPAVAEIRTPLFVAPDVTNVRLVTVGADFFTAAWEKPKGSFDYYWVEVFGGDRHTSGARMGLVGSCANGTIIHSDQTQVTCSQLKPCSKVGFKVRTHINGPPSRTSPGVTLNEILIRESVLPDVTHLKLITVGPDNFVLSWQPVKACFDYYTVELIDEASGRNISVSCNKGADINANETSVICDQVDTCANVTIRVRTHTRAPPRRSSRGAELRHVLLKGKVAPEVTDLRLVVRRSDSFRVEFNAWEDCFDEFYYNITLWRFPQREVKAACSHVVSNRSLFPGRPHAFICNNVKACGVVNFALGTRLLGPPRRNSRGVLLRGIRMNGSCRG